MVEATQPRTFKRKATRLVQTFFLHYNSVTFEILSFLSFEDVFKLITLCRKTLKLFSLSPPPLRIFASKDQAEKYLKHYNFFESSYCEAVLDHLQILKNYRHAQEQFVWDCRKKSPSLDGAIDKFDRYRLTMAEATLNNPFALMSTLKLDQTFRWEDVCGKDDELIVIDGVTVSVYWVFWHTDWCKLLLGTREMVLVGQGLVLWLKVAKRFMHIACTRVNELITLWRTFSKIPHIMIANEDFLEELTTKPELDVNYYFKNPAIVDARRSSLSPIKQRNSSPYRADHVRITRTPNVLKKL
jgi:hypothetical protein